MGEGKLARRWKLATALTLGAVIGVMLVAQPAGAHFLPDINHIWAHIKPKADARYAKKPTASRAAMSTTISDSTIPTSGSFATDVEIGSVTITVGGGLKQLVEIRADIWASYSGGTAPFVLDYYLAEGDQSVPANRTALFVPASNPTGSRIRRTPVSVRSRTTSTGMSACRTTFSAVDPRRSRSTVERPEFPTQTRSAPRSRARSRISFHGLPSRRKPSSCTPWIPTIRPSSRTWPAKLLYTIR